MPIMTRRSLLAGAAAGAFISTLPRAAQARAGAAISPEQFGARGDGVADDHAAWTKALAESARSGGMVVPTPDRVYKVGSPLVIGPGMKVGGPPRAATIMAPGGKGGIGIFMRKGGFELGGLRIVNNPQYHIQHEAKGGPVSNVKLSGLQMKDGSIGIATFAYGANNQSIEVTDCEFQGVDNPMLFQSLNRSRIHANRYRGASGANIMLSSGRDNRFENETIDGGRTGIVFLPAFSRTKFLNGPCENNVISNNRLMNVEEEFISFDHGNQPQDMAARDMSVIAGTARRGRAGFEIRLTGNWSDAGSFFASSHACIVTGALAGRVLKVVSADGGVLFFNRDKNLSDGDFSRLKAGDLVTLGLPFLNNVISGNEISGETGEDRNYPMGYATGIYLYNLCFGNRVFGNTVRLRRSADGDLCRGISIRSSHGYRTDGSIASRGRPGLATPSCNNLIEDNDVSGSDIVLDFHDYGAQQPYVSVGNRVVRNRVRGGRILISGHTDLSSDNQVSG